MPDKKFNPYADRNWKDRTNEVEKLYSEVLDDLKRDPHMYAELVADLYFHWKEGTFETPLMLAFSESVSSRV